MIISFWGCWTYRYAYICQKHNIFELHQDTTRVTQTNLFAIWFAGKSISRQRRIFSPVNWKQKLTGEMAKKDQSKIRESAQTTVTIP